MFTTLLCRRPATAVAWYSPGRTSRWDPAQPGEEVLRSQDTWRTPGRSVVSTAGRDPRPCGQSAEFQRGRLPAAMITDTNLVPMLNRHGWLPVVTARTVNRGVVPDWYQDWGVDRRSVTVARAQAAALPDAWAGAVLWCGDGAGLGVGVGECAGAGELLGRCVGAEPAAPVALGGAPGWPADELAVSTPFTVQPTVQSSPIPMTRTIARRRQYVARETAAGPCAPGGRWPSLPRGY